MSEDALYQLAQKRIDQRNRRWTLWAVDLVGLVLSLVALILVGSTLTVGIFLAWCAFFTLHTIVAALAESRTGEIEKEVERLRAQLQYEKPKRLELGEDGELVDATDALDEHPAQRKRHD